MDINDRIAEEMRAGKDALEYGNGGQLSDPRVDSIAWVADRGAPWWVGTYRDTAEKVVLDGLQHGKDILEAAGAAWNVELKEIYVGRKGKKIPRQWAVVRDDTDDPLGIVGPGYKPVQNSTLAEVGDAITDSGEAKYEGAVVFRGGTRVSLSMEVDHLGIKVAGQKLEEEIRTYLLMTNSHDGSMALGAFITPIRVRCWNTNNMAMRKARAQFRLRHTARIEGRILQAREALGITFQYLAEFKESAEFLAAKSVTDDQVAELFRTAVWPIPEDFSEARLENHHSMKALDVYYSSPTLEGIRGTAWGALQAVTEYVDWGVEYKPRGEGLAAEDLRAERILWGSALEKKEAALKALLKI